MNSNKVLINILTHGNELIGLDVINYLKNKYPNYQQIFDYQIANEKAYKEGKRFMDQDLNRVFPGKLNGSVEEKRAFELVDKIKKYDLVIDIHSTESGSEDIIIVTKIDPETLKILKILSPKNVLFMSMLPDTSLISIAKVGIAFEMGKDRDKKTLDKTVEGIEVILGYYNLIKLDKKSDYYNQNTKYFKVFDQINKNKGDILSPEIINFVEIKKGDTYAITKDGLDIKSERDFYPVIFGNDNYETIFGFGAERMVL